MSESDIIEVVKDAVYRINGIDNKTFPSRAAAKEHIKKVKKEEEERKNIEKELQAIMERSIPKQDLV